MNTERRFEMSALEMLFGECKIIAEEEIPEVMAINDQLIIWVSDAEKELADLRAENERLRESAKILKDIDTNKSVVISALEAENARLKEAVEEAEGLMRFSGAPVFVTWLKEHGGKE